MTTYARVDPRPNRPPALGLIASARLVADGTDTVEATHASTADAITPDPQLPPPVRWIGGFAYRPEKCNGGAAFDPVGTSLPTPDADEVEIDVLPYEIEGSDKRSTFGTALLRDEARAHALRDLLACESKLIEHELWTGAITRSVGSGNKYLADANVNLVEGDRLLGYITALAALEQAIADGTCGQQGMIHCKASTATIWVSEHMVHRVGNLLVTELGTIVVAGSGYDGSAPRGAAGEDPAHSGLVPSLDSAWAYATTIPDVYRGAITTSEPTEEIAASSTSAPTSNVFTTYARRFAAATFSCLQAAVHVDHTQSITVSGS